MDELKERLRRELDRLEPSPGGFEKTIRRVRARQRARRVGAAAVGLALTSLLVMGLWTLVGPGRRTGPGPASTGALVGGLAFADGRLIRFTAAGTELVATLPERIAPEPPVLTRSGVVVLTGRPSVGLQLWLVSRDGSVTRIAEDVSDGFAVDPAADVVAYATTTQVPSPDYRSTVHIVSLSDASEVSTSPELDFFAAVHGIAEGRVVLSTGDGASASVGLWVPGSDQVRCYPTYGRAEGTDPVTGISVLDVGDGGVPILVRFRGDQRTSASSRGRSWSTRPSWSWTGSTSRPGEGGSPASSGRRGASSSSSSTRPRDGSRSARRFPAARRPRGPEMTRSSSSTRLDRRRGCTDAI